MVRNKYTGKVLVLSSINHQDWHTEASQVIKIDRYEALRLEMVQLIILHISAPTKRKFDLTNKAESVMDLLVDNGILLDDNCSVVPLLLLVADKKSEKGYFYAQIYTQS